MSLNSLYTWNDIWLWARHGKMSSRENVIEFPVHMKWYMVMGASWENVIKFHLNGKWHVLWRFTGNVIKFHVHVKWYVFSGTSWGNVIELHVHVKWYIFMGASRENVIKSWKIKGIFSSWVRFLQALNHEVSTCKNQNRWNALSHNNTDGIAI